MPLLRLLKKDGVVCTDLKELVYDLVATTGMDPSKNDVYIDIDSGQGSLKVGLTMTDRDEETQTSRAKYSKGVAPKQSKNS